MLCFHGFIKYLMNFYINTPEKMDVFILQVAAMHQEMEARGLDESERKRAECEWMWKFATTTVLLLWYVMNLQTTSALFFKEREAAGLCTDKVEANIRTLHVWAHAICILIQLCRCRRRRRWIFKQIAAAPNLSLQTQRLRQRKLQPINIWQIRAWNY